MPTAASARSACAPAPHAKQVIGVERNPAAVRDAAANARRNKLANARFVCADATEWMMAAAAEGLRPDVVFLDPPRAGSTPECIAAVNRMKPKRIVYVSCDPETLARDVAAFTRLAGAPPNSAPLTFSRRHGMLRRCVYCPNLMQSNISR